MSRPLARGKKVCKLARLSTSLVRCVSLTMMFVGFPILSAFSCSTVTLSMMMTFRALISFAMYSFNRRIDEDWRGPLGATRLLS